MNYGNINIKEYQEIRFIYLTYLTLLKILMSTRKSVTRRAIRPGTTSGLMRKLTQLTMTNIMLGR